MQNIHLRHQLKMMNEKIDKLIKVKNKATNYTSNSNGTVIKSEVEVETLVEQAEHALNKEITLKCSELQKLQEKHWKVHSDLDDIDLF